MLRPPSATAPSGSAVAHSAGSSFTTIRCTATANRVASAVAHNDACADDSEPSTPATTECFVLAIQPPLTTTMRIRQRAVVGPMGPAPTHPNGGFPTSTFSIGWCPMS